MPALKSKKVVKKG